MLTILYTDYVPLAFYSHYYRENCDKYDFLRFKVCYEYDSLIKYLDTEIGNILFNACNIEYENFLLDNKVRSLDDSITIKELFLSRYSNAIFIRRKSTYTKCMNMQYLLDSKIPVKIIYRITPNFEEGYEYIKPFKNVQDSYIFRKNYLNEINGYNLFKEIYVLDTFYFNPDNL